MEKLVPYGTIWFHMVPKWYHMVPYGTIMVPYGHVYFVSMSNMYPKNAPRRQGLEKKLKKKQEQIEKNSEKIGILQKMEN